MEFIKNISAAIVLALAATTVQAQSISPFVLNATGGTAIIGGNEFDWSVGEMTLVSTFTNSNVIVTQGLLQPTSLPSGVASHQLTEQEIKVFPNPASTELNLQYTATAGGSLSYRILDLTGKMVVEKQMDIVSGVNTWQIDIAGLAAATYLMEVTIGDGNEVAPFKIQKLQ